MGKRTGNKGLIFVALGLGLIISILLPAKFIIVLLAGALIICGLALCKS